MSFTRRPAMIAAGGLLAAALVVPAGAAEAAPVVSATRLPVPPGTTSSSVTDLNTSGVAVGYLTVNGVQRAVRWSGNDDTLLATPAANSGSLAALVNDAGTIAGTLSNPGLSNVVVRRWLPNGTTSDCADSTTASNVAAINASGETLNLTFLGPHQNSADVCHTDGTTVATGLAAANALADDGRVAGYNTSGSMTDGTFAIVPVVRAADGTVTQLPVPAGKSGSAYGFGPAGEVVGAIGTYTVTTPYLLLNFVAETAVIWQNGQLTQLGTLGGATSAPVLGSRGVSRTGDVVGTSRNASGQPHAFLWRQGRMIDLGTLGGSSSGASAVNDRGQVVGVSTTASGASHAFLWSDGRMIDLGAPGGATSAPVDINNADQIVGYVQAADGSDSHPVRWTVRGA